MSWILVLVGLMALTTAGGGRRQASFLVLDLEGDGVYLSDVFYPVHFDGDGDGVTESMAWTALDSKDGFLWLDANGNGTVDDGTELRFGDPDSNPSVADWASTFDTLAALEARAGDADGVITPEDPIWSRLGVWVDRNHDGISTPEELSSLDEKAVVAIDLDARLVASTDGSLNRVLATSSCERAAEASDEEPAILRGHVLEIEFRHIDRGH